MFWSFTWHSSFSSQPIQSKAAFHCQMDVTEMITLGNERSYQIKCVLVPSLNSPSRFSEDIALGKIWQVTHLDASTHTNSTFPRGSQWLKDFSRCNSNRSVSLFSGDKSHWHAPISTTAKMAGENAWTNGVECHREHVLALHYISREYEAGYGAAEWKLNTTVYPGFFSLMEQFLTKNWTKSRERKTDMKSSRLFQLSYFINQWSIFKINGQR